MKPNSEEQEWSRFKVALRPVTSHLVEDLVSSSTISVVTVEHFPRALIDSGA